MRTAWDDFLEGQAPAGHAVQVYREVHELDDSVGAYLAAGFEHREPAIVIATAEHWERLADELAKRGWTAAELEAEGLLTRADAHETLAAFMDGDHPSPSRFEEVVGGLVDDVSARWPGTALRAFGEMVNVLCERSQENAAAELEVLWNDLGTTRRFALLCGYRLDVFDKAAQVSTLPHVCAVHSHVLPAEDPARLEQAVDSALEEVLGPVQTGRVYSLVAKDMQETRVPMSQLALMWVSENMPALADRILAQARLHYGARPLSTA